MAKQHVIGPQCCAGNLVLDVVHSKGEAQAVKRNQAASISWNPSVTAWDSGQAIQASMQKLDKEELYQLCHKKEVDQGWATGEKQEITWRDVGSLSISGASAAGLGTVCPAWLW